jgi:flagellar basal-body rod modification protein FlgD
MTAPVSGVGAPTDTAATASSRSRLADNFDTFLTLLTTQLKNQDPLAPMDSNAFTQQMVQMTGVEQQLLTNDLLTKLVGNSSNGIATAVSLIGKEVRAVSDDAALKGGEAKWTYNLEREADDLKIQVLDSKGTVVRTFGPGKPERTAGDHEFKWDGKDGNGHALPEGVYTLQITAKDSTSKAIPSTTYVQGTVTGVEQANGDTLITINGTKVSWEKITTIKQAANDTPAPGPTTDPDDDEDDTSNPAG